MHHAFGLLKKKGKIIIILCMVLSVLFGVLIVQKLVIESNRVRMLEAVGLENAEGLKRIDYACWIDPLKYVDGYEVMAFSADATAWTPPASWVREEISRSAEEIAEELGIRFNINAILDLGLGGEPCSSWLWADSRADRPVDEQEYYFAYCDDTARDKLMIFVYRGHHLYGL